MIGIQYGAIMFASFIKSSSLTIAMIAYILKGLPLFREEFSKTSKNKSDASTLHFDEKR